MVIAMLLMMMLGTSAASTTKAGRGRQPQGGTTGEATILLDGLSPEHTLPEELLAERSDDGLPWYEQMHSERTAPERQAAWDARLKEIKQRLQNDDRRQRRRAQLEEGPGRERAYDLAELDYRQETPAGSIPRGWTNKDVGPADDTTVLNTHLMRARLDAAGGDTCDDDPLASSEPGAPCAYSCEMLAEHYYPDAPEVVCYLFQESTNSWPGKRCSTRGSTTSCTAMGSTEDLMQKKQTWLDWHTFVEGGNSDTVLEFRVGAGATCVNVTVQTETVEPTLPDAPVNHTEERCVLEGYHEIDHSAVGVAGTTQIIGQTHPGDEGEPVVYHSVSHDGAETTSFTIGECEDVWFRFQTTEGSTGAVSFELDDGGHNGPWSISIAEANLAVGATYDSEPVCLFDNDFNLTKIDSRGWRGRITVLSKMPDNTITIPTGAPEDQAYPSNFAWYPDEDDRPKWIIHGMENAHGIPVKLDARLKSGGDLVSEEGCGDFSVSYASIVLRKVRFSNQKAALDKFAQFRSHSTAGDANSHGGALDYTGGWGAKIIIEGCVFDHLYASEGAGYIIDGQVDEWARRHHSEAQAGNVLGAWSLREADPLEIEEKYSVVVFETNNLYWECHGRVGGAFRIADSHPKNVTIVDTQYIDNIAFIGSGLADATYSNCFDDDNGVLGRQFITLSGIEMTDGTDTVPGFTLSPIRFGPLNGHWEVPDGEATAHINTIDDVRIYDQHLSCMPGFTFYNTGNCAGGCMHTSYKNVDVSDLTGTWKVYAWTAQSVFHWADDFSMTKSRIVNGGIRDDTETAVADGGGIHADISGVGHLSNTFIGGQKAAIGGAATFAGRGSVEVINCVFQGNVAWQQGGALALKTKAQGNLIGSCLFLSNTAGVSLPVDVDITVRVFTGATGYGLEDDDASGEETIPVWKIDGPRPNDQGIGAMGDCLPSETVYGKGSAPGGPDSSTTYEPFRTYAITVGVSRGTHTLWTGLEVDTETVVNGWRGSGWIDIVDVRDKIYPTVVDERSTRYILPSTNSTGCIHLKGDPAACGNGMTFWAAHDFEVPYGLGGGVASMDAPTVTIIDSNFTSNTAGRGAALSVTSALDVTITGTTYDHVDRYTANFDGATISGCVDTPCAAGHQCSNGQLSLFCDPCRPNEIGLDGVSCVICDAGTEPNDDRTACVACPTGKASTAGHCEDCAAGKTSAGDLTACENCPAGTATGLGVVCELCDASKTAGGGGEPFCSECEPGKTSNTDRSGCESCVDGTVRRAGESECSSCPAGKAPAGGGVECELCTDVGQYSETGTACDVCEPGKYPSENRTACHDCSSGFAGVGGTCQMCPAGSSSLENRISCGRCPAGWTSQRGSDCTPCGPGTQPNDDQSLCEPCALVGPTFFNPSEGQSCRECPGRQVPNADFSACFCKPGTFNVVEFGSATCSDGDSAADLGDLECVECPSCLQCDLAGNTSLKAGWAFYGLGIARRCPVEEGCTGTELKPRAAAARMWTREEDGFFPAATLDAQCATGYAGIICGQCAPGYNHLKVGQPCDPCEDGRIDIPMLLGLLFFCLVFGIIVVSGLIKTLTDHGIITDFRLMIGFYQILSQMTNILSTVFPSPVPELLGFVKLLFLDVRSIIRLDCWDIGGFWGKLTTNIAVIPVIYIAGCALLYFNQRKTINAVIAAGGADDSAFRTALVAFQSNLLVGLFLLYPTITTTLFRVPQCLELNDDHAFHEEDFSIDCNSGFYLFTLALTTVGILIVPVGVPFTFMVLMKQAKIKLDGVNQTVIGGAKLVPNSVDDDEDPFGYLCKDYKPEYYYYEIVHYSRK
eukprot:COSAG02_NODE_2612_length_8419_cov_2.286779_4_plen_1809_part_00